MTMRRKAIFKETLHLPTDRPGDHCWRTTDEDGGRRTRARTPAGRAGEHRPSTAQAPVACSPAGDPRPRLLATPGSRDLGFDSPSVFFGRQRPAAPARLLPTQSLGRETVEQDADHFHDSETDIFDLFNACDGVERDGLLDISKLDEYSPAEAEALNVPRLREIWEHTATGCAECAQIIAILKAVRATLGEGGEDDPDGRDEAADTNYH